MVPEDMRVKRSKKIVELAPAGTTWCAACQSFRDLVDFGKGATTCRACASARQHETMVEKTYGITGDDYAALLKRQGGRCAICRARPKSKRLAVDHDHRTGAVRGLLCSRCNHELMGSAWDSLAIASALWHYMSTPPAGGTWVPPEMQAPLAPVETGGKAVANDLGFAVPSDRSTRGRSSRGVTAELASECERPHVLPVGSQSIPGKRGVYRVWVDPGGDPPF